MIYRLTVQKGNTALLTILFVLVFILIILALFDLCSIYITREETKTVSDSIVLASSQELIFLNQDCIEPLAKNLAEECGCRLVGIAVGYDEIEVTVEKDTNITVMGRIGLDSLKVVSSSSRARVTYPWDRKLGQCDYYEFGYKPY